LWVKLYEYLECEPTLKALYINPCTFTFARQLVTLVLVAVYRSVVGEQEQIAVKALNLTSVFGEVDRLKEENTRLEKLCNDRGREIDLMRAQVRRFKS